MPCSINTAASPRIFSGMDSPSASHSEVVSPRHQPFTPTANITSPHLRPPTQRMERFLDEARLAFEQPLNLKDLLDLSGKLQSEFKEKLQSSDISMLPSYYHTLPTGQEKGSYLSIDIGGTNLRIALVELCGRREDGENGMRIVRMFTHRVTPPIRDLRGRQFFAWLADKIEEAINDPEILEVHGQNVFAMGVAWSFPIEQTSVSHGRLLAMGKEFRAADGLVGEDLTELIMDECRRKNLHVRMDVIINDGSATLLSSAYNDPNTRFGLILGTGTNASVMLPCTAINRPKFGQRSDAWHASATEVLVNTEYSMFGKVALPATRWDRLLNASHSQPDFQPYEQMIAGRYLGEVLRLVLVDAVQQAGLLGGILPIGLRTPYAVDTAVLAALESHKPDYRLLLSHLALPPSDEALHHIRTLTSMISHRACALLATAIHALWQLRVSSIKQEYTDASKTSKENQTPVSFACNGSVVERYPDFMAQTQAYVDELVGASGEPTGTVVLEIAVESALFGAAVAVSCLFKDEKRMNGHEISADG